MQLVPSQWNRSIIVVDAYATVAAAMELLKHSDAAYVVIARGDTYFYIFERESVLHELSRNYFGESVIRELQLHEPYSDDSIVVPSGALPTISPEHAHRRVVALGVDRQPFAIVVTPPVAANGGGGAHPHPGVGAPPMALPPKAHPRRLPLPRFPFPLPDFPLPFPGRRGRFKGIRPEAELARPQSAFVSDGFSSADDPGQFLRASTALRPGSDYFYWFEIGPTVVEGAIAAAPETPLLAPSAAELVVVLFTLSKDGGVSGGFHTGALRMRADGRATVERQPLPHPPGHLFPEDRWKRRLLFPIRAPSDDSTLRLRSSVYHDGTLVQSRLVEARVATGLAALGDEPVGSLRRGPAIDSPGTPPPALRSTVDYVLSRTLDPAVLRELPGSDLSMMMNRAGEDHGFTVYGTDMKLEARFDGPAIQHYLKLARGAFRKAAWGNEERWVDRETNPLHYRYVGTHDGNLNVEMLTADLIALAERGSTIYDQIVTELVARLEVPNISAPTGAQRREHFREKTRLHRSVQLALYRSARDVLPIALFYDHNLADDTTTRTVCESFIGALAGGKPLAEHECFLGQCPNRDGDGTVVCPGGFWGYRHSLGVPVGAGKTDAAGKIEWRDSLEAIYAVSQDFDLAKKHGEDLASLRDRLHWRSATTLGQLKQHLQQGQPHLVYFYCHGGTDPEGLPWFRLGGAADQRFRRPMLTQWKVEWPRTRAPLVLLNGCETAAVEPDIAIEFVSGFVQDSGAAGVLGTDITIFEELAVDFGKTCLEHFLSGTTSIGEAVRLTRLALLTKGNPLGLVYVPFVLGGLTLVERPN